jgi:FkbM family methyltransferase
VTPGLLALPSRAVRRARGVGRRVRWRLIEALAPRRTVHARGLRFTLTCDNWITQFRMDTFETKEPETLDWIDAQVRDGDLFFDVGGNIGVYTVYTALRHPRASVVVFEPEYANLHLLRDNIVANRLSERVQMYPIALSDRTGVSRLHVQDLTPGAALHTESAAPLRATESGEAVVMAEGAWAMRLDEFCAQAGLWPNAIKIDVDGGEHRVLAGARVTLARPGLRSLIVEAGETGLHPDAGTLLREAGLRQVETGRRSEAGNEVWAR